MLFLVRLLMSEYYHQYFSAQTPSLVYNETLNSISIRKRNTVNLTLCVPCIILQCVNDQQDAQTLILNFYSTVFCLLYMFRTNLVVHHQEHGIIYCIAPFSERSSTFCLTSWRSKLKSTPLISPAPSAPIFVQHGYL